MSKIIIILILLFSHSLFASPIFFKCDGKGQLSEFLTGKEVLLGLQKMQSLFNNKNKLFEALCEGNNECEKTLSQVLTLTQISTEAAQTKRDELLVKLRSQMNLAPIAKVNDEAHDLEKSIRGAAANVAACRQTLISLSPDDWNKNGCVKFYYPVKNEYTYASGYKIKNDFAEPAGTCSNPEDLKKAIRKALIMGVDPVMYLSIGLMEGGFNGWQSLYLDPIGVMRAMGCPEKKGDVTKVDAGKLNSFGNYHQISPGLVKDPGFSNRVMSFIKDKQGEVSPGKQYYCTMVTGANAMISETVHQDQCCVELNFKSDDKKTIDEALVQHYMYKLRSSRPYGSSDPAFRLQAFNGFSKLMGGAEGVPVFRSGVDYTKTPAYGYQAMDFILNNLESNPWLLREIEAQKKDLNLKDTPPSILCEGNGSGTFHVDSKHYLNLHRESGRMTSILNKPFEQMNERQQKVISAEIGYMINKGMFPDKINGKVIPKNNFPAQYGPMVMPKMKFEIETSDGKKSTLDTKLNGYGMGGTGGTNGPGIKDFLPIKELENGFSTENFGLTTEILPLKGKKLDLSNPAGDVSFPPSMINLKPPMKFEYDDGSVIDIPEDYSKQKCFKDNKEIDCQSVYQKIGSLSGYKATDAAGNGYQIKLHNKNGTTAAAMGMGGFYGGSQEQKLSYNDGKSWIKWKLLIEQPKAEPVVVDQEKKPEEPEASMSEMVSYYFKNLYKDRSTIEKASSYGPWKELTDDEIKKMAGMK